MKIGKVSDQANGKKEKKKPLIQEINPDPVSVPAVNFGTYKTRKDGSLFSAAKSYFTPICKENKSKADTKEAKRSTTTKKKVAFFTQKM